VVFPKTKEQLARIEKALSSSFLFGLLTPALRRDIFDCMQEIKVSTGKVIIKQYDEGDYFYVVDSGIYDVFIAEKPHVSPKKVYQYNQSGSFGELALMYNCPRSATIQAASDGVLWAVDRKTFRHIVVTSQFTERAKRESFLEKVPILEKLTKQERAKIADVMLTMEFNDGEYVIRQGDNAVTFYIIESGEAEASLSDSSEPIRILGPGGYFGERALITQQPRSANIRAKGHLKVGAIDCAAFERLFGKLKDVMARAMESYK